ncbi:hypothetical protein LOAG_19009, partial [Loa loa]
DEVKLFIAIVDDVESTRGCAVSLEQEVVNTFRGKVGSAPICVVAQSDNRKKIKRNKHLTTVGKVLVFYGSDVKAWTILAVTNSSEELRTKFENWKRKELRYLSSHQLIAFHFTVVNGTEPEDSEEIFSNTFPDIPLSTLRLLDESSMTGVAHGNRFHPGPVYAMVGFRKFGGENSTGENVSEI